MVNGKSANSSKIIQNNEIVIIETKNFTENSDPTFQIQLLCRYFDIDDPNFVKSSDLKYIHVPIPKSFPVYSGGFRVPILKKKLSIMK